MEVKNPITVNGLLLNPEVEVVAMSTANLATMSGAQTIDGAVRAVGSLVFLKNQTTQSQNGGWVVNTGAWTRIPDYDTDYTIRNRIVRLAVDGTTNKSGTVWTCSNASAIVVNTTAITYALVPMTIGTGAGQAAAGNHAHSTYAALTGAAFTGPVSARSVANTVQALTLSSNSATWMLTSGNSATLSLSSATADCAVFMSAPVAGASSRLSVMAGLTPYRVTLSFSGVTFIYNGVSQSNACELGAIPASKKADYALYWITTTLCSVSMVASDYATPSSGITRLTVTATASGYVNIGKFETPGSYLVTVSCAPFRTTFLLNVLTNYPVQIKVLTSVSGTPVVSAQYASPYVLLIMQGGVASLLHTIDIQRLGMGQEEPLALVSETGTSLVVRMMDTPYIYDAGTAATYSWDMRVTRDMKIAMDSVTGDASITIPSNGYGLSHTSGILEVEVADSYPRTLTLVGGGSTVFVVDGVAFGNSAPITLPSISINMFRLSWVQDGHRCFVQSLNPQLTSSLQLGSLKIGPAEVASSVPVLSQDRIDIIGPSYSSTSYLRFVAGGYQYGYMGKMSATSALTFASDGGDLNLNVVNTAQTLHMQIGYGNRVSLYNSAIVIEDGVTGSIQNAWVVRSDMRHKLDVADSYLGLDFVLKLRPVSYRMKNGHVEHRIVGNKPDKAETVIVGKDVNGDPVTNQIIIKGEPIVKKIISEGVRPHFGFIAQEIEDIINCAGVDFAGFIREEDEQGTQALRYEEFIAPIVKAIQELTGKFDDMYKRLIELEKKNA